MGRVRTLQSWLPPADERSHDQGIRTPALRPLRAHQPPRRARRRRQPVALGSVRPRRSIAAQHGLPLLDGEFYDSDASGSTFDRPQWERGHQLIREGKAGGIIAFDLKRIGRAKTAEMLAMIEDVESVGGQLYDQTGASRSMTPTPS
jgi:hypothetical protein